MPDRHQEARSHENMSFAELDLLFGQMSGMQYHKQRVAVFFNLRPLMRCAGIFDRQLMQAKFLLYFGQQLAVRLVQTQPDKGMFPF